MLVPRPVTIGVRVCVAFGATVGTVPTPVPVVSEKIEAELLCDIEAAVVEEGDDALDVVTLDASDEFFVTVKAVDMNP